MAKPKKKPSTSSKLVKSSTPTRKRAAQARKATKTTKAAKPPKARKTSKTSKTSKARKAAAPAPAVDLRHQFIMIATRLGTQESQRLLDALIDVQTPLHR